MREHEFSPAGQEFYAPADEFSRPGFEFCSPGKEFLHQGREFGQATAAAQKKRSRRTPLQLVTAAVVSCVIVLSGVNETVYPALQLSAGHKAYLDGIITAMDDRDTDTLLNLAADPMMHNLTIDVLNPYAEMLIDEYDARMDVLYHDNQEGIIPEWYVACFPYVSLGYDGTVYRPKQKSADYLSIYYGKQDSNWTYIWLAYEKEDGLIRFEETYGGTDDCDWNLFVENGDGTTVYSAFGNSMGWTQHGDIQNKSVLEGQFAEDTSDGRYYLHNGTLTHYVKMDDEWKQVDVIEVINGYTRNKGNLRINQDNPDWWYIELDVNISGLEYTSRLGSIPANRQNEEQIMYHTFW